MNVQGLGQSHVGLNRQNNEDSFVVDPDLGLYLVCDGMGGHAGGEVAAEIAVTTIQRVVSEHKEIVARVEHDPSHASDLAGVLETALRQACRDIYNRAISDQSLAGMGCTATAILVAGEKAVMGHVGDTRLYLIRAGEAHQLSADHTLAAEMARQGLLEPDQVRGHPRSNVLTRVLGPQALVDVETLVIDLAPNDNLLLCSDGLSDYIPSEAWIAEQITSTELEELPDVLIDFANNSGGRDNTTVIALAVDGPPPTAELPIRSPQLILDILGSSFLFADLSLAQLSRLVDRCDARTHEAGEVICSVGDSHDELLLIVSGTVSVSTIDGRTVVAGPGQHLGENFVLRPRRTRAKIVVEQRANILALDQPSLVDLAARRPWLGVALLTKLVQRMSSDLDRLTTEDQAPTTTAGDLL